jgi:hypothetical protein
MCGFLLPSFGLFSREDGGDSEEGDVDKEEEDADGDEDVSLGGREVEDAGDVEIGLLRGRCVAWWEVAGRMVGVGRGRVGEGQMRVVVTDHGLEVSVMSSLNGPHPRS